MKKILKSIIAARQARANFEIARMLQNSEYKNETRDFVLANFVIGRKTA